MVGSVVDRAVAVCWQQAPSCLSLDALGPVLSVVGCLANQTVPSCRQLPLSASHFQGAWAVDSAHVGAVPWHGTGCTPPLTAARLTRPSRRVCGCMPRTAAYRAGGVLRGSAGLLLRRRLQQPTKVANTADAPLRYTARSTGNCLDFAFPRQPRTTQTTTAAATAQAAQAPRRCEPPFRIMTPSYPKEYRAP